MKKPTSRRRSGVTIGDVAREVGVSAMTVSRVINNGAGASEATRNAVFDAVRKLNYVPHAGARSLAAGTRTHVGLLYAVPTGSYHNEFLLGALKAARTTGAYLLLEVCELENIEDQRESIRRLAQSGVDGIVLPPPFCEKDAILAEVAEIGLPVVTVGGPARLRSFNIRIDDCSAAAAITRYLIGLGHTHIAHIKGAEDQAATGERLRGYQLAMKEAGLEIIDDLVEAGDFNYKSGIAGMSKLLSLNDRPTAVFAANDEMAAAAINVAHHYGLSVPDDISIVGFDDTAPAINSWPEITTLRQPIEAMAQTAVMMLSEIIKSDDRDEFRHFGERVLDYELVIRDSASRCKNRGHG